MKSRFKLTQLLTLSLFFCLLMIISCQKENSRNGTEDQQEMEASKVSSESDAEAESVFSGLFDDAIGVNTEVGLGGTGIFGRIASCPDIIIDRLNAPDPFPVRITLDFGVNGCTGNDGHLRKGKIITVYTNRLLVPGAIATTTFDGFYFDSIKVEGTYKITNTSVAPTPPGRQFTADVINGKLTRPSGNFIEWNSHKVITQIEGLSTAAPLDDIFKIEGSAHGRVKRGALIVLWESGITEPLIKRFNCRWIVKGRIRTTRVNASATSPWVAVLDFGSGTPPPCDNLATLTINGVTHQITLP